MSLVNKIEEAKKLLKDNGYYVDNLWHIDDVKSLKEDITEEKAQEVLDLALTNEATMEQIWFSIKEFI